MGYQYKGIITKITDISYEDLKETLNEDAIEFNDPFNGVSCPLKDDEILEVIIQKSTKYPNQKYIFMKYDTWAGRIDGISTFTYQNGKMIEPKILQGEEVVAEEIFMKVFSKIGHEMNNVYFEPFT